MVKPSIKDNYWKNFYTPEEWEARKEFDKRQIDKHLEDTKQELYKAIDEERTDIQRLVISPSGYLQDILVKGDYIRKKEQLDRLREKKKEAREQREKEEKIREQQQRQEQLRGKHFVKCYYEKIQELKIKPNTAGDIIDLIVLLKNDSNILIKGGKRMNFKDIQQALGKSEKATREFLKLVGEDGLNIIITHSEGAGKPNYYSVNEEFHKFGKDEKVIKFVKLYKKKFEELTKDLKQREKGIIYKIIPYFHINEYCLCKNPFETDVDKIETFNLTELAKEIGVGKSTLSECMNTLNEKGIIGEFKLHGFKAYYVHPDLLFRKDYDDNEEHTHYLRRMFERNERNKQKRDDV